jgi:hypothetical protein
MGSGKEVHRMKLTAKKVEKVKATADACVGTVC